MTSPFRARPDSPRLRTPRSRRASRENVGVRRRVRRTPPRPAARRGHSSIGGSTTWVSGSPKRTLYSIIFGPSGGEHQPGVQHPAVVDASSLQMRRASGSIIVSITCSTSAASTVGHRGVRTHATGVRPRVAVADPLEVLGRGEGERRGGRRTLRRRRARARVSPSSITTVRPAPPNAGADDLAFTSASASARVSVTKHALARRQAVGLHDAWPGQASAGTRAPRRRR